MSDEGYEHVHHRIDPSLFTSEEQETVNVVIRCRMFEAIDLPHVYAPVNES
jgi:hypothetical protein